MMVHVQSIDDLSSVLFKSASEVNLAKTDLRTLLRSLLLVRPYAFPSQMVLVTDLILVK
jgi:hypothetical protein